MNYKRAAAGYCSKLEGETFENIISNACRYYQENEIAEIEKTPEPFRVERPAENGKFFGHYEKRAQPDFKGTLKGGRAVCFEAKHTKADKIEMRRVSDDQAARLEAHNKLGALAFVLVSFGLTRFFSIPWEVWTHIPEKFGRKYVTPRDLEAYEIKIKDGVLDFLKWRGATNGDLIRTMSNEQLVKLIVAFEYGEIDCRGFCDLCEGTRCSECDRDWVYRDAHSVGGLLKDHGDIFGGGDKIE